ncbi:hypothetical protein [Legionella tunisiensis]|uniref:hypothetical protein n=1 Tax=Legionella tunisiensis TaxID=1034944 RepID=UPI0012EA9273|nr:hypothetical protein [Legionella tunisiensis]
MPCYVNQGNCNDIANKILRAFEDILGDLFVLTEPFIENELASSMNQLLTLVREHDPENGIQTLRDIENYIEEIATLLDDVNFERKNETQKVVISSFSQFKGRFFSHKPDDSDVSFVRQFIFK